MRAIIVMTQCTETINNFVFFYLFSSYAVEAEVLMGNPETPEGQKGLRFLFNCSLDIDTFLARPPNSDSMNTVVMLYLTCPLFICCVGITCRFPKKP